MVWSLMDKVNNVRLEGCHLVLPKREGSNDSGDDFTIARIPIKRMSFRGELGAVWCRFTSKPNHKPHALVFVILNHYILFFK